MPDAHIDCAADDRIETAVVVPLRRVPERRGEYDVDSLTATQSKSLFLLVVAGLVEWWIRFTTRGHNHPVAVEATVTSMGSRRRWRRPGAMWTDWKDAFAVWRNGETRGELGDRYEASQEPTCRRASADVDDGHAQSALDSVLWRGRIRESRKSSAVR